MQSVNMGMMKTLRVTTTWLHYGLNKDLRYE